MSLPFAHPFGNTPERLVNEAESLADSVLMTFRAPATWRSLGLVAASALATILAADLLFQLFSPPRVDSEVEDAIQKYENADPDILVLGSSHARTFEVVDRELQARTGGKRTMLAVPVEWGKLSTYAWVLEHRLKPLIEEADPHGVLRRRNLEEFILVTEWWDSTPLEEPAWNLPSRAWQFRDFLKDFLRNGSPTSTATTSRRAGIECGPHRCWCKIADTVAS